MSFGDKLRAIRVKNKLSLEKLGKEIGVTKATIWQWENVVAKPGNIKTKNMDALCEFLNVSKEYFYDEDGIAEQAEKYHSKDKPVFDDMMNKSIVYVLDHQVGLSHEDTAVAIRLLYNKVKNKDVILTSDFLEVMTLLR